MNGWMIEHTKQNDRRYDLPQKAAENCQPNQYYITLQPLTYAQALQRESIGIVEWYYFDGKEPSVRRTYDLVTMADYDHEHCVTDFCLPTTGEAGILRADPQNPAHNLQILARMPPQLAAWVSECIADINMRSPEKRAHLDAAKKN